MSDTTRKPIKTPVVFILFFLYMRIDFDWLSNCYGYTQNIPNITDLSIGELP